MIGRAQTSARGKPMCLSNINRGVLPPLFWLRTDTGFFTGRVATPAPNHPLKHEFSYLWLQTSRVTSSYSLPKATRKPVLLHDWPWHSSHAIRHFSPNFRQEHWFEPQGFLPVDLQLHRKKWSTFAGAATKLVIIRQREPFFIVQPHFLVSRLSFVRLI